MREFSSWSKQFLTLSWKPYTAPLNYRALVPLLHPTPITNDVIWKTMNDLLFIYKKSTLIYTLPSLANPRDVMAKSDGKIMPKRVIIVCMYTTTDWWASIRTEIYSHRRLPQSVSLQKCELIRWHVAKSWIQTTISPLPLFIWWTLYFSHLIFINHAELKR